MLNNGVLIKSLYEFQWAPPNLQSKVCTVWNFFKNQSNYFWFGWHMKGQNTKKNFKTDSCGSKQIQQISCFLSFSKIQRQILPTFDWQPLLKQRCWVSDLFTRQWKCSCLPRYASYSEHFYPPSAKSSIFSCQNLPVPARVWPSQYMWCQMWSSLCY